MEKDIWYFKYLNDDYYGCPISGISELNHAICIDIKTNKIYQNIIETVYTIPNNKQISNLQWQIFDNENEAIVRYNEYVRKQISLCNTHIGKLIECRTGLINQLIKEKPL